MKEKRRFDRFKTKLEARYLKAKGSTADYASCTIKDISSGGVRAQLDSVVRKGDNILLDITSPDAEDQMAALVKVAWAKLMANRKQSICGFKYLWTSSKLFIDKTIEDAKTVSAVPIA